jgi:hypothetical protein
MLVHSIVICFMIEYANAISSTKIIMDLTVSGISSNIEAINSFYNPGMRALPGLSFADIDHPGFHIHTGHTNTALLLNLLRKSYLSLHVIMKFQEFTRILSVH